VRHRLSSFVLVIGMHRGTPRLYIIAPAFILSLLHERNPG
jgi:hypothetical protein